MVSAQVELAPVGPCLWSARDGDGLLLAFGRSRGEARRAAVIVSGGERPFDDSNTIYDDLAASLEGGLL